MSRLTGAQAFWTTLHKAGVDTCFANPGTTELDLVRALETNAAIRCVLGLQENVCTGAADGYGRMSSRAAATLLHLGPGFANGIANLHNARRARTPIVNIIGDHASWHLPFDAPLTSDIESLARTVSGWVRRVEGSGNASATALAAVRETRARGGQGATVIFPADFQASEVGSGEPAADEVAATDADACDATDHYEAGRCLERLREGRRIVFLLGGGGVSSGLGERAQRATARLCEALGARAYAETFPSRAERGGGLPPIDRLPYFPEPARDVLDRADLVVLAGAAPPITYFGYVGHPSALVDDARLLVIGAPGRPVAARLEELADALGAPPYVPAPPAPATAAPEGPLTAGKVGAVLARALPEGAIVSVEGGTCGYPFYAASATSRRHTTLTNTGGAIGQGLPVAMGAAIACPDRRVFALLSDGSTQYTIQTLWSLAHEKLDVIVLIAANHQYAILRNELRRDGGEPGARAQALTALDDPRIDWCGLARSYGVAATRATTCVELRDQLQRAIDQRGPALIEMAL